VIANGDITTPEKARHVLEYTGADGIMIGRAAQGWPWIFREIAHYLANGTILPEPPVEEIRDTLLGIWTICMNFMESTPACGWRANTFPGTAKAGRGAVFRDQVNRAETVEQQLAMTREFFDRLATGEEMAA